MSVRQDAAIRSDLDWISAYTPGEILQWNTHVDVEVSIANVKTINSLAEINVRNAVSSNVVVLADPELSVRSDLLDELCGGLDVG